MSHTNFTQGPWKVRTDSCRDGCWDIDACGNGALATVVVKLNGLELCPHTKKELEANAHLIAAAPEMYEALTEARECMDQTTDLMRKFEHNSSGISLMLDKIDAIQAKARGGD